MKGMLLAGVIAATAVAMPVYAEVPQPNPNPQAAPAPMTAPPQPPGPEQGEQRGGEMEMHARGGWPMRGGPMMHRMMGMGMRADPQRRCIDRLAWRAARRAYIETELNLTSEQRPLWDKLQSIAQSEQQRERQLCDHIKAPGELTMLDRIDQAQQFLSARLNALQAAKPAVQSLYQALTPEQRAIFDHPFRRD